MKTIVVYFRSLDEVNHHSSKDLQSQLAWSTLAPGEYETAAEIGSSSPRERAYYHIKIHKQILSINYLKTIFLYILFNFHRPLSS